MRILFIANELGYRGTPKFLFNCALIAKNSGHKILVWGLLEDGFIGKQCREHNIPVIIGSEQCNKAIEFHPDILHIHRGGGPSPIQTQILRHLKKATCCKILETNVFGIVDFTWNTPIDLHAHISYWDLWRWRKWLYPFHKPAIVLPYCIDTDLYLPTKSKFRQTFNIPDNAFLIGRLGKTDWPMLLNVLNLCIAKCENIWLASVNDYATLREIEIPSKIARHIVTIPKLNSASELNAFYSACDITTNFSTIGESFGYGIAESMSCGTPVVVLSKPRNDNAQIELASIENGGFPVTGARAAVDVIIKLSQRNEEFLRAKSRSRASIQSRYSIRAIAPKILEAYNILHVSEKQGRQLEKIFTSKGFMTEYPTNEILRQLSNVIGDPLPWTEKIKMQLAYSLPNAIRNYLRQTP